MSVHPSLKKKKGAATNRSVFTRWEGLQVLVSGGRWSDGESVYGLPKVRTPAMSKAGKKKKAPAKAEA